jgi:alpha-galactosidase
LAVLPCEVRWSDLVHPKRFPKGIKPVAACEWGPPSPWLWAATAGAQLWRATWDVRDSWEGKYVDSTRGITNIIDRQADLADYAGPGHWNDPDMLVVGLYGKGMYTSPKGWPSPNDIEYRSQMSM